MPIVGCNSGKMGRTRLQVNVKDLEHNAKEYKGFRIYWAKYKGYNDSDYNTRDWTLVKEYTTFYASKFTQWIVTPELPSGQTIAFKAEAKWYNSWYRVKTTWSDGRLRQNIFTYKTANSRTDGEFSWNYSLRVELRRSAKSNFNVFKGTEWTRMVKYLDNLCRDSNKSTTSIPYLGKGDELKARHYNELVNTINSLSGTRYLSTVSKGDTVKKSHFYNIPKYLNKIGNYNLI